MNSFTKVTIASALAVALTFTATVRAAGPALFVEILNARDLQDEDFVGKSDPYVRVMVHDDKGKKFTNCSEARWPVRPEALNPSWASMKMVCRNYPQVDGPLWLHVNVKEDDTFGSDDLGKFDVDLTTIKEGEVHEFTVPDSEGKKTKPEQKLRLKYVTSPPSVTSKNVFFVHSDNLPYQQALSLMDKIEARMNHSIEVTEPEKGYLGATRVLLSPLTSPLVSGVLAIDPMARRGQLRADGAVVVKPDARQKDTQDGKKGPDLAAAVMKDLRKYVYPNDDAVPASMSTTIDGMSLAEVTGTWWSDETEDYDDIKARIYSFVTEQIMWYDDSNIIVVIDGNFLRTLLNIQMQDDLKKDIDDCDPTTCDKFHRYTRKQITSKYLEDGGVLALNLDFTPVLNRLNNPGTKTSTATIRNLSFLFGTGLDGVNEVTGAPTAAPATSAPQTPPPASDVPVGPTEPSTAGPVPTSTSSPTPTSTPAPTDSNAAPNNANSGTKSSGGSGSHKAAIAAGAAIGVLAVLVLGVYGMWKLRRPTKERSFSSPNAEAMLNLNKAYGVSSQDYKQMP